MKIGQLLNFKMGRFSCEDRPISGKHGCLPKFFLEFQKGQVTHKNRSIFKCQNGYVAYENKPIFYKKW
jgi:hypothetical protein